VRSPPRGGGAVYLYTSSAGVGPLRASPPPNKRHRIHIFTGDYVERKIEKEQQRQTGKEIRGII